eukprot:TRINITY_DN11686_c0_g2_i1.p2 TRINITY_DN11686_c0_g2~~TRINITY_DN11686_c0_g2_i1.p2  ORF type:complete len:125 (-),score=3.53 TRINITY_DN11686_c0_g2_i1:101-475(-)
MKQIQLAMFGQQAKQQIIQQLITLKFKFLIPIFKFNFLNQKAIFFFNNLDIFKFCSRSDVLQWFVVLNLEQQEQQQVCLKAVFLKVCIFPELLEQQKSQEKLEIKFQSTFLSCLIMTTRKFTKL